MNDGLGVGGLRASASGSQYSGPAFDAMGLPECGVLGFRLRGIHDNKNSASY